MMLRHPQCARPVGRDTSIPIAKSLPQQQMRTLEFMVASKALEGANSMAREQTISLRLLPHAPHIALQFLGKAVRRATRRVLRGSAWGFRPRHRKQAIATDDFIEMFPFGTTGGQHVNYAPETPSAPPWTMAWPH